MIWRQRCAAPWTGWWQHRRDETWPLGGNDIPGQAPRRAVQAQCGPLLRRLACVRKPIESSAAPLTAHLLLAELSERIAAVTALTIDLLMLAEPSERITAITTAVADMLLRIGRRGVRHAPRLGLRRGCLADCR